jgi:tetratricopeptide (TPR) repeat protein
MRTLVALTIYVSLATGAFAEAGDGAEAEWKTAYESGVSASRRQNFEEALSYFQQSWDAAHSLEERGVSATDLGQTWRHLGKFKEARQWLERAREEWIRDPRQGYSQAISASYLADVYRTLGDYPGAERVLREAVLSSECDPELRATIQNNLADLFREEGRNTEAQPIFLAVLGERAASSRQKIAALIGLADIDRQTEKQEASIDRWNQVLEICRREKDEKTEAIALRGLATTWLQSGSLARAEPLLRRSLRIMENNPDTPPELLASSVATMGELYRAENKLALAENEWLRALQINRKALGETHPQVAWLMEMLADVYSARGDFGLAREYATKAFQIMLGSFGENSMPVAAALTNRALVEERANNPEAAANDYARALDIARGHPESRFLRTALVQRYAMLLKAMHRSREAKALVSQSDIQSQSFEIK